MKKLFPVAISAVLAITFTSCKKNYTCVCYKSTSGMTSASTTTIIHDTKKEAEKQCDALEFNVIVNSKQLSSSCSIK